jgi:signal transduction histidine kinase
MIARSIVGNMRRLVWAIDPENDKMNSIVQKIIHDKSQILDDETDFQIEMDPHLKNMIIPGEMRYQMSSICNEAFTNIAKYALASAVHVQVSKEKGFLKLSIRDDGVGFNPEEHSKDSLSGSGYGLANMKRRASRVGGTFVLHSVPGKGTSIEVKFPFT